MEERQRCWIKGSHCHSCDNWEQTCLVEWHWKHHTVVGVAGSGSEMMIGLLLALDSTTTSSPPGSVTCPVPTPGVPHQSVLPLPCWASVESQWYHSIVERGAAPEWRGKGLVSQANWEGGLMVVSVEERDLVGEEALAGHGEWGLALAQVGGLPFSWPVHTVPSTGSLVQ